MPIFLCRFADDGLIAGFNATSAPEEVIASADNTRLAVAETAKCEPVKDGFPNDSPGREGCSSISMASRRALIVGVLVGVWLGATGMFLFREVSGMWLGNGILRGWEVTRDNETLLCRDPVVYIRAKQIECE